MNTAKKLSIVAAIVVVLLGGVYWVYDRLTGNHVEIESVIAQDPADAASPASSASNVNDTTTETKVESASLDGAWTIQPDSKVYFSVTTSRETVNYEMDQLTGTWTMNTANPAQSTAEGTVDLASLDSGNSQRDGHVSGSQLLDTAQFPNASFKATSFEGMPAELTDGDTFPLIVNGDLTVKGLTKEVVFTGQAAYQQEALKLEASTVVTFGDFGMTNPHTVIMDTENNLTVELRLIFGQ